jgi:hypothetical protein
MLGMSFTTRINSCVKTASSREWSFSAVCELISSLITLWFIWWTWNRCRGFRSWHEFVRIYWNKICYRILSISGRNIPVTFLVFVWGYKAADFYLHRHNHPETLVYCQDSSALLKQAVAQFNNEHPAPLLSNDRKTFCPDMPDKNSSIDFIFGGLYFFLSFCDRDSGWVLCIERAALSVF